MDDEATAVETPRPETWEKLKAAGWEAYREDHYAEAEKHFVAALQEAERFGEQDLRLATSLAHLAVFYDAQGKHAEAEPHCRRALGIRGKALELQHSDVAESLKDLAGLYHAQGKYALAEPLYQRALAMREKALGPEHPDVAQSLENYAALLRKTYRDAEAARLETRAKAIRATHAARNPLK